MKVKNIGYYLETIKRIATIHSLICDTEHVIYLNTYKIQNVKI